MQTQSSTHTVMYAVQVTMWTQSGTHTVMYIVQVHMYANSYGYIFQNHAVNHHTTTPAQARQHKLCKRQPLALRIHDVIPLNKNVQHYCNIIDAHTCTYRCTCAFPVSISKRMVPRLHQSAAGPTSDKPHNSEQKL